MLVAACATTATPPPTASPAPSPSGTPPPTAGPSGPPGSITVTPCVVPTPAATICLGADGGSMAATGAHGTTETLVLNVRNPGATSSTPVAVLLWVEGGGALPFGQPVCTACNSTAGRSVVGLEWPALAPGETRALLVGLPVSAGTGIVTWSATLYARSLADVLTDEIANGVQPGQATWKVALTVTGS